MIILKWICIALTLSAYLFGLKKWIYEANLLLGLAAMILIFPILIALTSVFPAYYLRAVPVVAVVMFVHHYKTRVLHQIKLLWFTTLTVLVVQGYYAFLSHFFGVRLWQ